jgi:hypothetical protein
MRRDCRLRDDTTAHFYNRHLLHTLAILFYTEWDDALLVISDGGGDTVCHSYRHFANRKIKRVRLPNEICCSTGFSVVAPGVGGGKADALDYRWGRVHWVQSRSLLDRRDNRQRY